jgi:phage terminase Nu1 subunit (DNA packaging protein)
MTLAAETAPNGKKLTIKELAARLDVSRSTLHQWREAGCNLAWSVPQIRAWRAQNRNVKNSGPLVGLREQLLREQIRKAAAAADAQEMANSEAAGRLVDAEDVALDVAEILSVLRCRMEEFPESLMMELPIEVRPVVLELATGHCHRWLLATATAMQAALKGRGDGQAKTQAADSGAGAGEAHGDGRGH